MFTSNFNRQGKNSKAVSISAKAPVWYTGKEYKKLAPWFQTLMKYKETGDREAYIKEYTEGVLNKLNPLTVYNELGKDAILLCYEGSEGFCHRHIVAKWFKEKLDITIKEI
jgi:uncharacterized protein (DUF488 family)